MGEFDTGKVKLFLYPLQWVQSQILFCSCSVLEHLWTPGFLQGHSHRGRLSNSVVFRGEDCRELLYCHFDCTNSFEKKKIDNRYELECDIIYAKCFSYRVKVLYNSTGMEQCFCCFLSSFGAELS